MAADATNAEFRTLPGYHPDLVPELTDWSVPGHPGSG